MVEDMNRRCNMNVNRRTILCWLFLLAAPGWMAGEPTPAATSTFNSYAGGVEARLAQRHRQTNGFLAGVGSAENRTRLIRGESIVEQITPAEKEELPGAMLHHWRGTAFAPGAKATDFERIMRDFAAYPRYFAPQVLAARVTAQDGDRMQATMRVRQKHIITVVMDTTYDVAFGRLDAQHGWSVSKSTRVAEIDAPGTAHEHALRADEEHGFLWRQDTFWSYEERDGGLYLEIESVSLSRAIPRGLGWAVGPFVESVPRESLEFTLNAVGKALRR